MACAVLGIVIRNLQTFVQSELATIWGVDSHVKKLCSNLTTIDTVLQDAEEKQITIHAVKDWLLKVSDAAHVLDDILDDCSIQSNRLQYEEGNSGIAHSLCLTRFSPKTILFRRDLGRRMKEVSDRFHGIDEEKRTFELREGVIERQQEDDTWRQTCSVITEPHIFGRDQDRELIVKFLLSHASESGELSVYPVVGMGGLGKTTLARWVFNDDRVIKHFDLKIWVCVSTNFNMMRILQSIVESITGQKPNISTLEAMQKRVQKELLGQKYLLVLDDMWEENQEEWNKLKYVLPCERGTKSASVLVTTRLDNVASIVGTCQTHHLLPLAEDDNWSLFKHHAFGPNREERPELVAIGKEIVKKCAGSPLACKALGSLLLNKSEEKQWLSVKESKFWDIDEGNVIMRALRISYFNLKLSLRHCFSFCAIYPEDYKISKEQLIHLWMAIGLIKSRRNLEVEDVGNEVWEELFQKSFFQEVETDLFGNTTFKIHDLFLELAQSIMKDECMVSKSENLNNLSSRAHHLSYSDFNKPLNLGKNAFKKFESLRTFVVLYPSYGKSYGLKAFYSLRALRIGSPKLTELKSLTHLRYLNLCGSYIKTLPDCVSRLQKLQILKLEHCKYLSCLPKQLTKLKDLRHILIRKCWSLVEMPPNISEMKCLKTLNIFTLGSKRGLSLAELYDLQLGGRLHIKCLENVQSESEARIEEFNTFERGLSLTELHDLQLGGKLHIKGLENVQSESEARSANLISKKELSQLYLSWDCSSTSKCTDAEKILEALEPHCNLKSFGMKGYMGKQFPSWMINTSVLSCLVSVILYDCENCEQLPPLGKLPHLADLYISGMSNVKYIDDDSYDGVEEKAFKSLKSLPNLERMLRDDKRVEMLPLLSELRVDSVPKLRLPLLPSIEILEIKGCNSDSDDDMASFLEAIVPSVPHVKTLRIENLSGLNVSLDGMGSLNSLQELDISGWDELESFKENVLQGLSSLRTLRISWCKKLKSLPEGVGHLTCLENLSIHGLRELVTLPKNMNQLTALRHVDIYGNSTLPEGLQRIPSLQTLTLGDVDSLPEWLGDMTSLQMLEIMHCPKLRSLPSSLQHLTNLRELLIEDCTKLEQRCKRETGEDWQNNISQIKINPEPKVTFWEKIQLKWDMRKRRSLSEFDLLVARSI